MFSSRGRCFPRYRPENDRSRNFNHGLNPDLVRSPSPPIGRVFEKVTANDVLQCQGSPSIRSTDCRITDCKVIASFNWQDGASSSILVPGSPPMWTPPAKSLRLKEDQGEYFRDPNAARYPDYPLAPAVQAVTEQNPDLIGQEVDLFACTSTLGNLLRFVRRIDNKPFRFLVEVVGNTVFFVRHENSAKELIPGVRGFGHTFPEAYTTWAADVKNSASHQRLLKYSLAGLSCIVRFQCDGYLGDKLPTENDSSNTMAEAIELDAFMDGVRLTQAPVESSAHEELTIRRCGQDVPQEAVFDLKTRSIKRRPELRVLEEELPRLWLAQIPNFILAYHQAGKFETPEPQQVWGDVLNWEKENKEDILRLRWLIDKILSAVKGRSDCKLEVRCKGSDSLELHEQASDESSVLPPKLKAEWFMEENASGGSEICEPSDLSDNEDSDDDSVLNYTACSAEDCGYCGRCSY